MIAPSANSDGAYTIAPHSHGTRGTKIVVNLKEDHKEFADGDTVEEIIKKHSYFVPFPLYLNGKQVCACDGSGAIVPLVSQRHDANALWPAGEHGAASVVHVADGHLGGDVRQLLQARVKGFRHAHVPPALHLRCAGGPEGVVLRGGDVP